MKLEKVANTVFKIKIKSQEIDGLVIPDNQDKPGASNPNYQTPNKRDSTNLKKTSTEKPSVKSETREEFESFKRKLYRKITILESFATISEERQKNAKNPNNKTEDDDSLKPDQNSDKTVVKKIELKEEEKKEIDDFFSEKEKSKINDNIEKINNLTFGVLEEIRNKPKEANKPREANKGEELKKKIKEKFESLGVSYTDDYTFDEELKLDFIDLDKIKGYLKNKLYSQLVENFKKNFPSKDDTKILLYLFEKKKEEGKKDGFYSKVFEAYLRDIEKRAKTKNGREGVKHIIPELIEHLIHHTEEATPEEIAELARKEYGSKTELWYVANRLESDAFEDEKYLRQFLKKLKKDPETPFDPNKGKGKIDKDKIKKREPAEIIQRAYKDYLERKKKKEEEEKKKKKIESATKIQALYRGYKVRKLIKLKNSSDPDSDPDSDSDSDLNPDSDPDLGSGSGSGSDFNPNSDLDKTLKKLQEIIKNLQGLDKTAIDELLKKIESLNKQIVNLDSSKIDDLKKELEDFKQNLQNLATKLDLDDAKKELENSIASLGNSIAQLQDQINNLNINNSSITSNNYFSANDLQSFYKKRGLDDILIPSVLGDGRDNAIEIKKYGLPIFAYDGLATNNLFEYNLKEAFDAWEKEGNHNADSRYTSLGGQQQKTLVSIARLTNRTLPGAVDCYAVNTVTARGVTKSFISETEFAAEIEAPLQDFYDAQLKFLENQITNGKIPTFEESFTLANLAPSKNLEDRLFQAEILDQIKERRDQKRKANVEKLEAKIDEGFEDVYQVFVNEIKDNPKKTEAQNYLNKGDYKALREFLADDKGELTTIYPDLKAKVNIFGADPEIADAWKELNERRNDLVGALQEHSENNLDVVLEVLEEEKKRLDAIVQKSVGDKRALGVQAFTKRKYQEIVDLIDPTVTDNGVVIKDKMHDLLKNNDLAGFEKALLNDSQGLDGNWFGSNFGNAQAAFTESKDNAAIEDYLQTNDYNKISASVEQGNSERIANEIERIKNYEEELIFEASKDNYVLKPSFDSSITAGLVKNLGLQDKLAKKIANENSMNYSSNFLTQKVNRTIEKNAKALVLTDDEKKLIAEKEKNRSYVPGQDTFYSNYYENLEKTLNIDLPLASFKGVSFLNKSPNEISVTFNDSTNNIAYIHIPGTNQAYVRAQLCKQDGPMTVCENGKKVIKEYKKGDVVIDSETIFHYVPTMIKDKNGNPTLVQQVGVDGKPLYEYRPVGLEDTYSQTAGNLLSKGADTILGIASLGLLSSGRDTKSRIKREFGLDDYEHVVKRYKDIKVLAVATNENGERSVATLHDGKAVNHSVLGREEVKVVDAPEPMNVNKDLLGIRADKDSNGAEIKFVFDEKGNLKDDGNLCTIEAKNSSKDFYGYGRYVSCDNFKIGQLQLFAKVGVITGEGSVLNHSGISSARDGDIFFKQNLYYTNPANPNEKLPMFKNDGSFKDLSADFLKYCRDNGIQLTAKDIPNLVYNFQNNFSAAVSVEIEKPKDIQEFDGSNISRTKYQLQSINAPMVVRPGKAVENDLSLKEDLLHLRANTIAASAASRTTPDFSNLKELNTQVTNIKNYKNLSAERKAKPVSAAFGLLGKPNTDFKPTGAELLKASAERRQHV